MVAVARNGHEGSGGVAYVLQCGGGGFTGAGGAWARPTQFGVGVSLLPRPVGNRILRWRTVLLQVVVLMLPSGSTLATSSAL